MSTPRSPDGDAREHSSQARQSSRRQRAMSSAIDVPQPSSIWSYFSTRSSATTTRNRRASSTSLPNFADGVGAYETAREPSRAWLYDEKAASMNHGQKARLIKAAGLIGFVIILFYFFAPASRSHIPYVGDRSPQSFGNAPSDSSGGKARCTKPYKPHQPLIQYALMVDAGSTGSRIHVYRFNNCGPTPELEDEVFKETTAKKGGSGLSSYREDAEGAAKSLDVLLDTAMEHVPDEYKSCTPIAVKATAGLRKLGPELSNNILNAVRTRLETVYPFPVVSEDKGGVEVMDGKDEGVYAWITTNYLLGKIGGPDTTPSAAVFDLGGGSTQIVFEPNFRVKGGGMPEKLADGDHKYELDFGGRKFTLYQHSYLGYGLMAARQNLHRTIVETLFDQNNSDRSWLKKPIINPCIAPQMSREIEVELSPGHELGATVTVEMIGPKEGLPAQCRALTEKTLRKEKECKLSPCAFDGVHQPPMERTFATEDVYLFSYFYDRTKPLGMPDSFTLRELKDLAYRVCQGKTAWGVFKGIEGAIKELEGRPESCLDLNFMLALLHTGYELPIDREVKIAKKIKGNELGWCLGASLPLLNQESGWKCRIKTAA